MLILFYDFENIEGDDPMDAMFSEAVKITSKCKTVWWIRRAESLRRPNCSNEMMRPHWLSRIYLHYGYDLLPAKIKKLCSETIFTGVPPFALFVELHEYNSLLTEMECASLLALLANISNWISSKRSIESDSFSVIVVLRAQPEFKKLSSLYTDYIADYINVNCVNELL
ncbi:hypothetical protein DdX_01559 [Ditylenchus destructor]|uniref:Uncharacterized protein n=1 Tax=Ditylenchus destructor TaxID=166010 RepID=A0AAD4NH07_9BILA|nr:hypothetical protein DdX_01559 [Ditylenchus destructor]